jgi:hypothetical protein
MQALAQQLAKQRLAKAEACDRTAKNHAGSTNAKHYAREARYWRTAAALAEAGDTTARPALTQTEDLIGGQVLAMVYRPAPTGLLDCVAADVFSDFTIAHEWARLHADELNGRA